MLSMLLARGAILLTVVALAAGCGSSSISSSKIVNDAVGQCLAGAKKISDPSARKTAEEACKAVKSGDVKGVRSAAKKECLAAAKKFPDGDARKKAEAACEQVG